MKTNMTKLATSLALVAGVSMIAVAPAVAMQDAEETEKKVIIKEKKAGDKSENSWVNEMVSEIIVKGDDDKEHTIVLKKTDKNGEVTVDVKGGEIVETSEDGKTYTVKDANGKLHTIKLAGGHNMMFFNEDGMAKHRIEITKDGDDMSWTDEEGNVHKMDGENRFFVKKGEAPMMWRSKDGEDVKVFTMRAPKPMAWSGKMRAPMMFNFQERDEKRAEAMAKIDAALADIEEKKSKLKQKKSTKAAHDALDTAAESLKVAKEALENSNHNVFQYRTSMKMMDDEMAEHLKGALKNLDEQEIVIGEMRKELNFEIDSARDELANIFIEIKEGEDGEMRKIHLKAIEEAQMDLEGMEEERLEALKRAEADLAKARKELEKKLEERKKKEKEEM